MLRTSIRSARALGRRPNVAVLGRQWQAAGVASPRSFADKKKPEAPQPVVLPASETNTTERTEPPSPLEPKPAIPIDAVPLTPPKPDITIQTTIPKTASTPPPPPPAPAAATPLPRKKGFFRRLRNLILTLTLLGAIGFGGGVWYSRVNDNFHDFFTEYVPYGEQAVLYLEEMDFRKRFSSVSEKINRPRDTAAPVKIPAQSGASWRVADSGEPTTRQSSSAVDKAKAAAAGIVAPKEEKKKVEEPVKAAPAPVAEAPKPAPVAEPTPVVAKAVPVAEPEFKAPEVNEPSRFPPIAPISPLTVNDAVEPVVQDLVHMLNGIIAVINADKAQGSYGSTIEKAKGDLNKVGSKIKDIKAAVEKKAAEQVRQKVEDFDAAAGDLVKRVEAAMAAQEANWRGEFEQEMKRVRESYDERIKLVLEREQQLNEERLNNRLLDQALALKKDFISEVQKRVEEERDGRLGKLNDLSAAVADLEKLTVGWNDVVDASQQTQQLHVAVEAVRASIDNAQHPRPFIRELVALKETAASDPVVDAAIASINPTAYQRGLPTTSQLVERFRGVATEVRKASLLSEDAGVASHASSYLLSKVMFKKQGLAAGDDVESILTRTQTHLEEGDLDAAAREINGLQGWAKTLSKDWLGEVRKVLEVQQALDVISTEARLQSLRVE
ncbi:mitofilin [Plectosphaerella plurivora]|uniref:MICOS complex subunit MIC60 n=1 Tax=Plectosphaerella plurivora TaxID=936078 RepID=A0A9P8V7Q8_9PEZI|nr:mitofilin [Plectosphaerella plurivora]